MIAAIRDCIELGFSQIFGCSSLVKIEHGSKKECIKNVPRANESSSPKVYLLCCAEHANLGDQAITYAEVSFLKKRMRIPFIMLSGRIGKYLEELKRTIKPEDIICLHGGGNMGTLYKKEEYDRLAILESFPNNSIISFPQTISFDDSFFSKIFARFLKKKYSKHKNLTLFARENMSFECMSTMYPENKIFLTPDIVLSLPMFAEKKSRHGLIFCMRNDKERILKNLDSENLLSAAKRRFSDISFTDTTVDGVGNSFLSPDRGEQLFQKKIHELANAELVITDRIHGMIFCALSGTNCIALNNSNRKVEYEYFWLKDLPYIHFAQNISEAVQLLNEVTLFPDNCFPENKFYSLYSPLESAIRSKL